MDRPARPKESTEAPKVEIGDRNNFLMEPVGIGHSEYLCGSSDHLTCQADSRDGKPRLLYALPYGFRSHLFGPKPDVGARRPPAQMLTFRQKCRVSDQRIEGEDPRCGNADVAWLKVGIARAERIVEAHEPVDDSRGQLAKDSPNLILRTPDSRPALARRRTSQIRESIRRESEWARAANAAARSVERRREGCQRLELRSHRINGVVSALAAKRLEHVRGRTSVFGDGRKTPYDGFGPGADDIDPLDGQTLVS